MATSRACCYSRPPQSPNRPFGLSQLAPARETEESDLSLIVDAIRRRIWVVVLCLAVAALAAAGLSLQAEKRYEATASLLLRTPPEADPQRVVDTNLQLLTLPVIESRTAERVGGGAGVEAAEAVEVEQQGESDIVEVTATATEPELAARTANAYAEEFVAFREEGGKDLPRTGRLEIVERASPSTSPVSPKPLRNVIFGGLVGLMLGLGVALLLEQLDRRVKREDDLAEATGLSQLAAVPKLEAFDGEHLGSRPLSPAETEVFRMLRANLRYFNVQREVKSVLLTSAEPGEGKTLVSLGLALAAVTSGERVLLLEADMRDPGLTDVLGLAQDGGLSGLLAGTGEIDLAGALTELDAGTLTDAIGEAKLDVLPAGAIPPNPTELVESQRMKDLIAKAEAEYDFVVVDTPPILIVSDAIPLIPSVSGVLAISGLGVSTRKAAASLAEQLERLSAPTLGMVANFAESGGRSYKGYGYGRSPSMGADRAKAG